jgi:hypothetical protein
LQLTAYLEKLTVLSNLQKVAKCFSSRWAGWLAGIECWNGS